MLLVILMVVRKKKRRKYTQLKRKINTFVKKHQDSLFPYIQLMVHIYFYHEGKGNVTQNRKTCPSCGPGVFMAQHWDRYYCGSCHTTIKMDAETIKKN